MGVFDKEEYIDRLIKAYITYPLEQMDVPKEKRSDKCIVFREDLSNLINKYKEQGKIIELMAEYIDFDKIDLNCTSLCVKDNCREQCIIDYFKKKAKGE